VEKPATSLNARFKLIFAFFGWLIIVSPAARAQFKYATNAGAVTITGYTGKGGSVTIPAAIHQMPVTAIRYEAFEGLSNITSILIPDSVTDIGYEAFLECKKLARVSLPDSVTNLEEGVFWGCASLENITIPGRISAIGEYAFNDCVNLASVMLNQGLVSIGEGAFSGTGLRSITIPGSVTNIGESAFAYSSLAGVILDDGVNNIGNYAFNNCSSLVSVAIPGSVTSIGDSAFAYCALTSIEIPETFTNIANSAFAFCANLTNVTIPGSVTIIGDSAFAGCYSLTGLTIPEGVTSIGASAFSQSGLTSITIPGSVTNIGESAFASSSLVSATMDDGVTNIGSYAFNNCAGLTRVTIPGSVSAIGASAFAATGLASFTVPDSVTSIGSFAFASCPNLASVTIPASVTNIGADAFQDCTLLANVNIAIGTASIGDYEFSGCSGLASVAIPVSVTRIGSNAFAGCGLTNITIPGGVTNIGQEAFYDCARLTSITIPGSVSSTGNAAFQNCVRLTSAIIAEGVTNIGNYEFAGCSSLASVALADSVSNIGSYAFSGCSSLTGVTLPDSVASIGTNAFSESGLTSVAIPGSAVSIGAGAFSGCSSLTAITVDPHNAAYRSINGVLFDNGQTSLLAYPDGLGRNYSIPTNATSIGEAAFSGTRLTNVTIPGSVTNIGDSAFANCISLTKVYFGGNPPTADLSVFSSDKSAKAYYLTGTTGWGSVFAGIPAILLNPEYGFLAVTISPPSAITDGAKWRVDGGAWHTSGATVAHLLVGNHTVHFNTIRGWASGTNQMIAIASNITSTATGTYVAIPPAGSLRVTLAPKAALAAGALWQVDGGAWQSSGEVVTNLLVTNHTVSFNEVGGWTPPSNKTVMIKPYTLATTSGTFAFSAQGIYNGLFMQAEATTATSGMISGLAVTTTGAYSGKLLIGGSNSAISGSFNTLGQASNYVKRTAQQGGSLNIEMTLHWNATPPNITGTVTGANASANSVTNGASWVANLTNELAVAETNSAEYTTLLLPPGRPPGDGYILMTNHAGSFTLIGALADGTPFSQTLPLSGKGDLPVYGNLYSGHGLLLGWISLESGSPAGNLTWIKKASRSSTLYSNGFTNLAFAQGSPWTNPLPNTAAIDLPSGQLALSGGNLLSNLTFSISVTNNNALVQLTNTPTNSLTGSINPKTGLLKITFGNGVGPATTAGTGAVLQNATNAGGFFLGKTNAGSIFLQP
jgi:hypothetical protein